MGLLVRYAPWWLNLRPTVQRNPENDRMVVEHGGKNYDALPLTEAQVVTLPLAVQRLVSWNVVHG